MITIGRARNRGIGWVNPYITDGLIAMWDGEWNAGGGADQDRSAAVWKDLVGNADLDMHLNGGSSWMDKCVDFIGNINPPAYASRTDDVQDLISSISVIEIVFKAENKSTNGQTFIAGSSGKIVCISPIKKGLLSFGGGNFKALSFDDVSSVHSASYNYSETTVYVDGEKNTLNKYADSYSAEGIYIGSTGVAWQGYHGKIYSVRLYNRALTESEVTANYAVDRARFGLEGL